MKKKILLLLILFFPFMSGGILKSQSPYISKVFEFMPAPGQFTNQLPEYVEGDTKADILQKVEDAIANNNQGVVSLGGYGGYIVFGFDHLVENKAGYFDFKILGNAFATEFNPDNGSIGMGGNCEPGIVMVAYDANNNGVPDEDEWYELAGSEYYKPETIKDYKITYYKPDTVKEPTPDNEYKFLNDTTYIRWIDNQGKQGYISRNTFHSQPYYPEWIEEQELIFEGTKLMDNAVDENGDGMQYVLYAYHWGYADNHANSSEYSNFDISWAIDKAGNPVQLPGIHFIKVYTGLNQYCGWIGETSTEISGAVDLHTEGNEIEVPLFVQSVFLDCQYAEMEVGETISLKATIYPSDATDQALTWWVDDKNILSVDASGEVTALAPGTAIVTVITSDGYYIATCEVTIIESEPEPEPGVGIKKQESAGNSFFYADGKEIILYGLEDYNCALISLQGEVIKTFRATFDKYTLIADIPAGVYIISACKGNNRKIYKWIIP